MASKRKITRVKPLFGNRRSHSMKATRHKFQTEFATQSASTSPKKNVG